MSKNLTIDEGGESRRFDGVRRLKTKLMGEDAGTCYWVPDDETQAWPTFIMSNGMHSAEDEGVYGFSEASVNVYIPSPDPDWKIIIDDIDIPHIIIEDIDIDIDDIDIHIDDIDISIDDIDGTPVVDIEGIDLDGIEIPNIDIHMDDDGLPISDIDFKTDIHVWTDPDDHTKIHVKEEPNGEEIVLDYDDIDGTVTFKDLLDIRYDDTVIDEEKWVIEAHTKIKVDDVDYEAGDEIKSWDKDEIVDFTMKVEQEISVDFPDIDPDFGEDFDIELDLDNMELDMDGLDMDIDLPLLKMPDLDDELPDEIRIMHVPDKTSYKDGEAIDLDGIVVQAYKNGSVWQNKKYVNGYIPAHELSVYPTVAESSESEQTITKKRSALLDKPIDCVYKEETTAITVTASNNNIQEEDEIKEEIILFTYIGYSKTCAVAFLWSETSTPVYLFATEDRDWLLRQYLYFNYKEWYKDEKIDDNVWRREVSYGKPTFTVFSNDGKRAWWTIHSFYDNQDVTYDPSIPTTNSNSPSGLTDDEYLGRIAWTMLYGQTIGITAEDKVTISWPRPNDKFILTDTFDIAIENDE